MLFQKALVLGKIKMKIKLNYIIRAVLCLFIVCGVSVIPTHAGFLYVLDQVNGLPNQIYCFLVDESTGSLVPVPGFPISTGGNGVTGTQSELLTIDRSTNRLYVINKGSNTVSAFTASPSTGALTPMPFSPFTVVTNANTIAVHPTGSPVVIGGNTGTPLSGTYLADSYDVTSTTVTRAAGAPFNTSGSRPISSVFSRDGNSYYTGGGLSLVIAGFSVDTATDILTPLAGTPYGGFGVTGIRAYAADTQGRLFTATSGDGGLRIFTTSGGVPTQVSGSPFATSFATLTDGVLSPNEQFYVIADSSTSQVISYQISGTGASTTVSQTGIAGSFGSTMNTLAFNQAGTFLFAANSSSRSIGRFSFNQTSGAVTHLGTTPGNTAGTAGFLAGMDYLPSLAPTAAEVSISGQVLAGKRGIARAIVTISDGSGNIRSEKTNSFGYFRFDNVAVGQTYILDVSAKGYSFAPQVVSVNEELTNFEINAL